MLRLRRWSGGLGVACLLLAARSFAASPAAGAQAATATATKKGGKIAPSSAIDINSASQSELESVPGIGTSTAKKIIAGRPYASVGDLSKAGLSAKQIQSLSPMLKAGPAATAAKTPAPNTAVKTPPPAATTTPTPAPKPSPTATNSAAASATCTAGQVWVNTETKVFHRQGDKYFQNTKHGKCMNEADAMKAGYHETKQKR